MKKVLIINGHQYYDFVAKGELTQKYIDKANDFFIIKFDFWLLKVLHKIKITCFEIGESHILKFSSL